jgi:hypothetical protein
VLAMTATPALPPRAEAVGPERRSAREHAVHHVCVWAARAGRRKRAGRGRAGKARLSRCPLWPGACVKSKRGDTANAQVSRPRGPRSVVENVRS